METSMPQAASSTSVGFNAATGTDAPIRALVLCSGGVDSTTLLAMAVKRYGAQNVYALSISYGQQSRIKRSSPLKRLLVIMA